VSATRAPAEELTAAQCDALHGRLVELRRELKELLETSASGAAPVDLDEPIGRISRIDAIQQQSMVRSNRESMQRRLQQIESALRRLAEDEYGLCASCGEPVGYRRLEAQPETPLCIQCQSGREA
jgi:DnaK suppressor protein